MKGPSAIQPPWVQAHYNAMSHSDEFVMEALVSYDRLTTLVHELLVIEVWRDKASGRVLRAGVLPR